MVPQGELCVRKKVVNGDGLTVMSIGNAKQVRDQTLEKEFDLRNMEPNPQEFHRAIKNAEVSMA
jgi:hypothetical protein